MADEIQPPDASAPFAALPADAAPAPPLTAARFDRADAGSLAVTTAIAFAVYWFTLAPDVTLGFSGILSTGANYLGVPHPPGYPAWTIYSWFFIKLIPFSNIAWRVAIGSAVASAVACGLVAVIVSYAGKFLLSGLPVYSALNPHGQNLLRIASGAAVGLILAFTNGVWHMAVIVDIWALSLLLFAGVLFLLTLWMMRQQQRWWLYAAFFLFGLLLTNSQEMIVLSPALVIAVMLADKKLGRDISFSALPLMMLATSYNQYNAVWTVFLSDLNWPMLGAVISVVCVGVWLIIQTRRFGTEWKSALLCAFSFLFGLALYFYNPISSMTNPPVNWGYPRTLDGFWHVLSRGQYEHVRPTEDFVSFVQQSWWLALASGREFNWLYLVIALLPFALIRRFPSAGQRWLLALVGLILCTGFLRLALMNPPADLRTLEYFQESFAPFYAVLAVALGLGLMMVGAKMTKPDGQTPS